MPIFPRGSGVEYYGRATAALPAAWPLDILTPAAMAALPALAPAVRARSTVMVDRGHSELEARPLKRNYGDSLDRVRWRSKETLDMVALLRHAAATAEWVLFVEDDAVALPGLEGWVNRFVASAEAGEAALGFASLYTQGAAREGDGQVFRYSAGTVALLFPAARVSDVTRYLVAQFDEKPPDWLLADYLYAGPTKSVARVASPETVRPVPVA